MLIELAVRETAAAAGDWRTGRDDRLRSLRRKIFIIKQLLGTIKEQ